MNLLYQKVAQKVTILWATSSFEKNINELNKVAQLVKNHPLWSPWTQCYKTFMAVFYEC
jgi:hypothetical protein